MESYNYSQRYLNQNKNELLLSISEGLKLLALVGGLGMVFLTIYGFIQ